MKVYYGKICLHWPQSQSVLYLSTKNAGPNYFVTQVSISPSPQRIQTCTSSFLRMTTSHLAKHRKHLCYRIFKASRGLSWGNQKCATVILNRFLCRLMCCQKRLHVNIKTMQLNRWLTRAGRFSLRPMFLCPGPDAKELAVTEATESQVYQIILREGTSLSNPEEHLMLDMILCIIFCFPKQCRPWRTWRFWFCWIGGPWAIVFCFNNVFIPKMLIQHNILLSARWLLCSSPLAV